MKKEFNLEEFISNHGNSFHIKTVKFLTQQNWQTQISPYYNDNQTDRAREIDIVAEVESIKVDLGTTNSRKIIHQLFIECKKISKETVFWMGNKNTDEAKAFVKTNFHLTTQHDNNSGLKLFHNLNKDKVVKLFASSKNPHTKEEVFEALNQILNGTIYFRSKHNKSITASQSQLRSNFSYYTYTPIILCENFNNIHLINIDDNQKATANDPYYEIEVNYSYKNRDGNDCSEYFLIDFVNFEKFGDYLGLINEDIKLAQSLHQR